MVKTDKFLEFNDKDLQLNLCRLPSNLGGITSKDLDKLLEKRNIRRSKNNNYLRTKYDKCIALMENNIDNLNDKITNTEQQISSNKNKEKIINLRDTAVKDIGDRIGNFKDLIATSIENIKGQKIN